MSRKISVLIACYNAENYIGEAMESVLTQDYSNVELIVVDDGSTDASANEIAKFKRENVTAVTCQNAGHCAAANEAFRMSTGELIKFFDADDVLMPGMLKIQADRLQDRTDAIAMGEWARFYDTPERAEFPKRYSYYDARPSDWLISEWMTAQPMTQCGMFLIPRPIIESAGLWDVRLTLIDDFEYFTRVLLAATEILYTENARLAYRSGLTGSISGRKSRNAIESQALSLQLGVSHLLQVDDTRQARLACANILQMFIFEHFPFHEDLRRELGAQVKTLGGSNIDPIGPPGFHTLRKLIGWRAARIGQRFSESVGLNRASFRGK